MVLAPSVAGLFKWRQFEPEMILLAVGWYLRFSLSYRDVEELLAERGLLALSRQSLGRRKPSGAARNQHRRARRLSTSHRAAQIRGCSGGELPASTGAVSQ